jgi:hypothetical protein
MSLFGPQVGLGRTLKAVAIDMNQYANLQPLLMEGLQSTGCERAKILSNWSCLWLGLICFSHTRVKPTRRNMSTRSRAVFTNSFRVKDSIRGGISQSNGWNARHVHGA